MISEEQQETLLQSIQEAELNMDIAGDKLSSDILRDQQQALALLFRVRDAVMDVLDHFSLNISAQELYRACEEETSHFSSMVHNVLTHGDMKLAYEISSYYASIVGSLLRFMELPLGEKQEAIIGTRPFNTDLARSLEVSYEDDDDVTRQEIGSIISQLQLFQCIVDLSYTSNSNERYEVAMEIVRIREVLHNMVRELSEYYIKMGSGESTSFEDEFDLDLGYLDQIVDSVIEHGTSPEVVQMIARLMDFALRIHDFLRNDYDEKYFQGPFLKVTASNQ